MLPLLFILLFFAPTPTYCCKCYIQSDEESICSEYARKNFIQVTILDVIDEERELRPIEAWEATKPPRNIPPSRRVSVRVSALVEEVYRQNQDSDLNAGDVIELESGYASASCGVGYWINPGATLIINTDNTNNRTWLSRCSFIRDPYSMSDWAWDRLEELLRSYEC
eukprot:sb/3472423/